ncbi:tRNA (5-methylaminomethyl-2-thiouridine)(34)-methyltransferase MnmD [Marinoscillum furvescens]|uniref:tRNA U34 5-methylaminomethyl-2-thiouridine-forming methyltransferase MnmC n=1 Tax=Marinoscillum furvescens DSM 4134 TaxID=1122208 RepID=A0A3D9L478_MARFU|nr:tRNA (5-methylaminomethyl-2-thiouridine)(34)-methyltransferase MnmD [Marinoscillum furvescens]RED98884.1 tRNA U34 5-methylaminomethyl-2-thiouridine-forming methyltransferase MnmC [Marinoscillum furvescens DSM 4134]
MKTPNLKLITTEDGSHSLYREDLNETYHSFRGAEGESLQVFIKEGLDAQLSKTNQRSITVFEVGFGTGLNAFLAAKYASQHQVQVHYHSVEPYPVPKEIYEQFNFGKSEEENSLVQALHAGAWEEPVTISAYLELVKYQCTLEEFDGEVRADVVFYDAFAPSKQAEVWALDNLKKCFEMLVSGGVLVTYCAQGQFKRNLAAAGFEVETLPGAMGKKEMVRGLKL